MHHSLDEGICMAMDRALEAVAHLTIGYSTLAQMCHNYHVSGFADVYGTVIPPLEPGVQLLDALVGQIGDDALRRAVGTLTEHTQLLIALDQQIVAWLAQYSGMAPPQDRQDRMRLAKSLQRTIAMEPEGSQGPVWALSPDYQVLVQKSENIMALINNAQEGVSHRLQQLISSNY